MALRRGRAPSHSLTTQASRSWPSRLTTAINPSKNQECKRQPSLPDRGANLLASNLLASSPLSPLALDSTRYPGARGPFPLCPDAPSTQQRGPPNCIDSLTHFSQGVLSAISWPFRALQKAAGPVQMPTTGTAKPDGRRAVSAL